MTGDISAGPLLLTELGGTSAPFVVFDEIDGSGKSTLVEATARLLEAEGHHVVVARSPPRASVERRSMSGTCETRRRGVTSTTAACAPY